MLALMHHDEILTQDERREADKNLAIVSASIFMLFCVQIPLSARYIYLLLKRQTDSIMRRQYQLRLISMPVMSYSMFWYGKKRTMGFYERTGEKYLGGLSDQQLQNFDRLYAE